MYHVVVFTSGLPIVISVCLDQLLLRLLLLLLVLLLLLLLSNILGMSLNPIMGFNFVLLADVLTT